MVFTMRPFALTALATTALGRALPQQQDTEGDCSANPSGSGPVPSPDTPEAFRDYDAFSQAAVSAQTPSGYVLSYKNQTVTYNNPQLFAGYKLLDSYDVGACAAQCDSFEACNSFNIFFERDPSVDPGDNCPNPASTTNIKCVLWSGTIIKDTSLNYGQYQKDFHVVMAGSNAYVQKVNVTDTPEFEGYSTDTYSSGGAIEANKDCYGNNTYLGVQIWRDGQFDPKRCIDVCEPNNDCHFVNTYLQLKNNVPYSQHCSLYSVHWPAWYATNLGQSRQSDDIQISYNNSYGFTDSDGSNFEACEPREDNPILIS